MSIKLKSSLFRDLLYLNEVIKFSQISAAAEKNGIKASNLSKLIKDLEELTQQKLFLRTNKGLMPTAEALKLSEKIEKIENCFDDMSANILNMHFPKSLKVYIPENIQLKNIYQFDEATLIFEKDESFADVIIGYQNPKNAENMIVTETSVGTDFKQKIWISAKNTPIALNFARFIICQMHL